MLTSAEYNCNNHLSVKSEEGVSSLPPVEEGEENEDTPEVDIHISNVVCNFSTRCHLNLRQVAMNGSNVIYKREQGMVSMKIRHPNVTASIWSSGKVTVTGATSNEAAKKSARRIARILQKMGFKVKFSNFRIVNVLGTVILPFGIKITQFTERHRNVCSYEPELHPGATYKFKEVKGTLKIFQTGAMTITAPSVTNVQLAVEHIYPLVYDFKKEKPKKPNKPAHLVNNKRKSGSSNPRSNKRSKKRKSYAESSDEEVEEADESEEEPEFVDEEDEGDLDPDYYSDKSE